jgi:hypothetical protein
LTRKKAKLLRAAKAEGEDQVGQLFTGGRMHGVAQPPSNISSQHFDNHQMKADEKLARQLAIQTSRRATRLGGGDSAMPVGARFRRCCSMAAAWLARRELGLPAGSLGCTPAPTLSFAHHSHSPPTDQETNTMKANRIEEELVWRHLFQSAKTMLPAALADKDAA